jgi:hypothetical protein
MNRNCEARRDIGILPKFLCAFLFLKGEFMMKKTTIIKTDEQLQNCINSNMEVEV